MKNRATKTLREAESWPAPVPHSEKGAVQDDTTAQDEIRRLLSSPDRSRQAMGWLAVLEAAERSPRHAAGLMEANTLKGAPADLQPTVLGAVGRPLKRHKKICEALGQPGGLREAARLFSSAAPGIDRRLTVQTCVEELESILNNAGPDRPDSDLADGFHALSLGPPPMQQFLVRLVAGLSETPVGITGLPVTILAELARAVWTIVCVGSFHHRSEALETLGVLFRACPTVMEALPSQEEGEGTEPALNGSPIARSFRAKQQRYRFIARAVAGEPAEVDALFKRLGDPATDLYVKAMFLRMLPALWRQATPERREKIRDNVAACLQKCSSELGGTLYQPGSALLRTNLAGVASSLFSEQELREVAIRAVQACLEAAERAFAVEFEPAVGNAAAAVSAGKALASVIRDHGALPGSPVEPLRCKALDWLERSGPGRNAEMKRWNDARMEGAFSLLADLLSGTEGGEWKEPFFRLLLQAVEGPADHPGDGSGRFRFLLAQASLHDLFRRIRRELHGYLPRHQLLWYAQNSVRSAVTPSRLDAVLAVCFANPTEKNLAQISLPAKYVILSIENKEIPDTSECPALSRLLHFWEEGSACFKQIPETICRWNELGFHEHSSLVRSIGVLLEQPAVGFLEELIPGALPPGLGFARSVMADQTHNWPKSFGNRPLTDPQSDLDKGGSACKGHAGARRREYLIRLLKALPNEAVGVLDEEIEAFMEGDSPNVPGESGPLLHPLVLTMSDEENGYHLCTTIARMVDIHIRRQLLADKDFDVAIPILQLMLNGLAPMTLEQFAVRQEDTRRRELTYLIYNIVARIADYCDRTPGSPHSGGEIAAQAKDFLERLRSISAASDVLEKLCLVLEQFVQLCEISDSSWTLLDSGKALDFFLINIDELGRYFGLDLGLHRDCETILVRFRTWMHHYRELPVEQFQARSAAIREVLGELGELDKIICSGRRIQAPVRHLIVLALKELSGMFQQVRQEHVQKALLLVERGAMIEYFHEFAAPSGNSRPGVPFPPGQRLACEGYFVKWAASELEIGVLKQALSSRWRFGFRSLYNLITNLWGVLAIMAFPFLLAGLIAIRQERPLSHHRGPSATAVSAPAATPSPGSRFPATQAGHFRPGSDNRPGGAPSASGQAEPDATRRNAGLSGVGFALYALFFFGLLVTLITVASIKHFTLARKRGRRDREQAKPGQEGYLFECFLPRLLQMIVVPMAFLVDFDHSYHFPINASDMMITLLFMLAILAAFFYVGREVAFVPEGHQHPGKDSTGRHRLIGAITGLAMFEAFVVAVVFSTLFGSNYFLHIREMIDHSAPFLHWIPKEVVFDPSALLGYAGGFRMEFYPTVILVWTSLGLFTGIFLEGFFKGERLRGKKSDSEE